MSILEILYINYQLQCGYGDHKLDYGSIVSSDLTEYIPLRVIFEVKFTDLPLCKFFSNSSSGLFLYKKLSTTGENILPTIKFPYNNYNSCVSRYNSLAYYVTSSLHTTKFYNSRLGYLILNKGSIIRESTKESLMEIVVKKESAYKYLNTNVEIDEEDFVVLLNSKLLTEKEYSRFYTYLQKSLLIYMLGKIDFIFTSANKIEDIIYPKDCVTQQLNFKSSSNIKLYEATLAEIVNSL
jgi:hypothetical protein